MSLFILPGTQLSIFRGERPTARELMSASRLVGYVARLSVAISICRGGIQRLEAASSHPCHRLTMAIFDRLQQVRHRMHVLTIARSYASFYRFVFDFCEDAVGSRILQFLLPLR